MRESVYTDIDFQKYRKEGNLATIYKNPNHDVASQEITKTLKSVGEKNTQKTCS